VPVSLSVTLLKTTNAAAEAFSESIIPESAVLPRRRR
jgi:hypothetical protein